MQIQIKVEPEGLKEVASYPKQAKYATSEALKMTGGHERQRIVEHIESGGSGTWPSLHPLNVKYSPSGMPLQKLAKFVRFKFHGGKSPNVHVGFPSDAGLSKSILRIANLHEKGKTIRVSSYPKKYFIDRGMHLRKTTKQLKVPARSLVEWVATRDEDHILEYYENSFRDKFNAAKGRV